MISLPSIAPIADPRLEAVLRSKIDHKFKPYRALGRLEDLALQLCMIQRDDVISLREPQALVIAADHGVAVEGLSDFTQDLTHAVVRTVLAGGAAVNVLARQHGFRLTVVDAGVAVELPEHPELVRRKLAHGTRNMALASAMTPQQAEASLQAGMEIAQALPGNVISLGDLGVANSASAAMMLSRLADVRISEAAGGGSGWTEEQVRRKREVLLRASLRHKRAHEPMEVLACFGGFEVGMLAGAMLQGAAERRVLLIDGYVSGAAALLATRLVPAVRDYMVFAQRTADEGHGRLLEVLGAKPLLDLDLRLGEGIGALMAWPLVQFAARFTNEMASFQSVGAPLPQGAKGPAA